MRNPDKYRNLPPKMKRFAQTSLLLFVGAPIAATALRPLLGFWVAVILLLLLVVAVLTPLARAARKERTELQRPNNSPRPSS
jgi:membrane protein implicated in regulation of membrane protease activity